MKKWVTGAIGRGSGGSGDGIDEEEQQRRASPEPKTKNYWELDYDSEVTDDEDDEGGSPRDGRKRAKFKPGDRVRALLYEDKCFYDAEVVERELDLGAYVYTIKFTARGDAVQYDTEEENMQALGPKARVAAERQFSASDDLWSAARTGDVVALGHFLAKKKGGGDDVNEAEPRGEGRTALYYACEKGHRDCVKKLLQEGAEDRDGSATLVATPDIRELLTSYGFGKTDKDARLLVRRHQRKTSTIMHGKIEAVGVLPVERKHLSASAAKQNNRHAINNERRAFSFPETFAEKLRAFRIFESNSAPRGLQKLFCFAHRKPLYADEAQADQQSLIVANTSSAFLHNDDLDHYSFDHTVT